MVDDDMGNGWIGGKVMGVFWSNEIDGMAFLSNFV